MNDDIPSGDLRRTTTKRYWKVWWIVLVGLVAVLLLLMMAWQMMIAMPGSSHKGPLSELDEATMILQEELQRDVEHLAGEIGERNLQRFSQLEQAARWIEIQWQEAGHEVQRQTYTVAGLDCHNLEIELPGSTRADELVIVGAHYDSAPGTPGANDNGSGVAALLALSRRLRDERPERTLRFVAFTNEEPPHFQTEDMGSLVYARRSHQRNENIVAMLSLETIGYYVDRPGSQQYPPPFGAFYPSEGNFLAVVGNVGSRHLVRQVVDGFRRQCQFPVEGAAVPGNIIGVGWSDHWAFWQYRYPAVMLTDTALFRYPYYHHPEDTPDKLKYDQLAVVVSCLENVVRELASPDAAGRSPAQP